MISQLSLRVLIAGLDDWVPLAAVHGLARQLGAAGDTEDSEASIASIRELVENNLVELGAVSDGGFFVHEDHDDRMLSHISGVMRTADSREWGFSYWMQNTPSGDELARVSIGNLTVLRSHYKVKALGEGGAVRVVRGLVGLGVVRVVSPASILVQARTSTFT